MEEKRKPTQAVALEYDPANKAPKVIAMGRGALADRIIEKAKDSNIPVHRDDKLADTLSKQMCIRDRDMGKRWLDVKDLLFIRKRKN